MATKKKSPRKGVTAFGAEEMEENGDVFVVLELHHGLGESTRVDLGLEDIETLVKQLRAARKGARNLLRPSFQPLQTVTSRSSRIWPFK